jgi:molybdate transport system substrate-binding protein
MALLVAWSLMLLIVPAGAQERREAELVVFAAASLHDACLDLEKEFRIGEPAVTFVFNFAGSRQLAEQLVQGAAADLFASASMNGMNAAGERMDTSSVRTFARNRLVVAVPNTRGRTVRSLAAMRTPGAKIVIADRSVPAGEYAIEFLTRCEASGEFGVGFRDAVLRNVVSYEENVRAVLSKIMLDEADAGIVYVSDIGKEAGRSVAAIEIPDRLNVAAAYQIGRTKDPKSRALAERFIAFLLSEAGQRVLVHAGFTAVDLPATGR